MHETVEDFLSNEVTRHLQRGEELDELEENAMITCVRVCEYSARVHVRLFTLISMSSLSSTSSADKSDAAAMALAG